MAPSPNENAESQLPWLPDEHFELALDARTGVASSPAAGDNLLTVTSHRAIKLGAETGKRTTSMVPLDRLTAVEVIDATRPAERLTQGIIVFIIGAALGWVSQFLLGELLITLLVGGLPVLVSIYMLTGYAFPDTEGELVLHTGAYTLRQPLLSVESRRDAYLAAHRIYDLMIKARSVTPAEPEAASKRPANGPYTETPRWREAGPDTADRRGEPTPAAQRQRRWPTVWGPGFPGPGQGEGGKRADHREEGSMAAEEARRGDLSSAGERLVEKDPEDAKDQWRRD